MSQNTVIKQRTITGLLFSVVLITLVLSGRYGAMVLGAIILVGGTNEYVRMIFPNDRFKIMLSIALNIIIAIAITLLIKPYSAPFYYLNIISCIALLIGIVNLYKGFINHTKGYLFLAVLYLGLPLGLYLSFVFNHLQYSGYFWMALFVMIWMSDSFAYLVGSRIGKRKLFEKISPKKSWEGFLGAGIITLPIAYFLGNSFFSNSDLLYNLNTNQFRNAGVFWIMIAAIAWVIGTLGDLVESSVKRTFNIKDSGTLLPGHGGILDRFDSFIYILPFILLLLFLHTNQ